MAWNVFKKKDSDEVVKKPAIAKSVKPVSPVVTPVKVTDEKDIQSPRKKFSVSEHSLFVRPIVTEKSLLLAGKHVYSFEVDKHATKIAVKKGFFNLYGVMPTGVRLMNMAGKDVRFGRMNGRRKDWKKALVSVPKDKTIDIA